MAVVMQTSIRDVSSFRCFSQYCIKSNASRSSSTRPSQAKWKKRSKSNRPESATAFGEASFSLYRCACCQRRSASQSRKFEHHAKMYLQTRKHQGNGYLRLCAICTAMTRSFPFHRSNIATQDQSPKSTEPPRYINNMYRASGKRNGKNTFDEMELSQCRFPGGYNVPVHR